jgi:hypothetical protein
MSLDTRPATPEDLPGVLALARRALGWTDTSTGFLEWKHLGNPFGRSFMWVAVDGDRVVSFRAFLRWELADGAERTIQAARAVDTATDPDHRRQGLFRSLTTDALGEMAAQGVELVWNTPNASSLPGYLAMGWHEVGRLPVVVRPASARFPFVVATARRAAGRNAVASDVGTPASAMLADVSATAGLLRVTAPPMGLTTHRTPEFLAWRYTNPALGYRVLTLDGSAAGGVAVFRLRRRGRAVEAVVGDVLVPAHAGPDAAGALVRRIGRSSAADYVLQLGRPRAGKEGAARGVTRASRVRLPQTGPVLACRPLDGSTPPALERWALTMGDVELL